MLFQRLQQLKYRAEQLVMVHSRRLLELLDDGLLDNLEMLRSAPLREQGRDVHGRTHKRRERIEALVLLAFPSSSPLLGKCAPAASRRS